MTKVMRHKVYTKGPAMRHEVYDEYEKHMMMCNEMRTYDEYA
jgi:hypothetical protein